ncbi:MAG: class I SAM-dependent methyltransferase [Thermaerobacter sp.]|nr:class I SAM-dependent methyltransferase [Thermaerobacter sp.]
MAEERMSPFSTDYVELLFHWHRYQSIGTATAGKRILEVGCGTGYGADYLAETAAQVVGADIDGDVVAEARSRYQRPNLEFVTASAQSLPFLSASFDVVVMFEVIEHLERDQQWCVLSEVRRVLTPNGLLFLSTPDHARTVLYGTANPYHVGELTEPELRGLLSEQFADVAIYYQDVDAGSFLWAADQDATGFAGYAMTLDPDGGGSKPAPVHFPLHLTLIAVASSDGAPLPRLQGFCVNRDRVIWNRLWADLADAKWLSTAKQKEVVELHQAKAKIHLDNRALSDGYLKLSVEHDQLQTAHRNAMAERDSQLAARDAELARVLNDLAGSQARLASLQGRLDDITTRLQIIENARSWRLIQRYWRWMEHSPLSRPARWFRRLIIRDENSRFLK